MTASDSSSEFSFSPEPLSLAMSVNSTNPEAEGRDADNVDEQRLEFKTVSKLKIRG